MQDKNKRVQPVAGAIQYYKLNAAEKKLMVKYLRGKATVVGTARALNRSHQKVYNISNSILRHAVERGAVDVEVLVKGY